MFLVVIVSEAQRCPTWAPQILWFSLRVGASHIFLETNGVLESHLTGRSAKTVTNSSLVAAFSFG